MPPFTGVDLRLPGQVIISAGTKQTVSLETFSNLLPEIITEVVGNTLVIRSESCLEYSSDEAIFYVTLPTIENVELKSSGEVRIQGVPTTSKLTLNLSGSGTINYFGDTPTLNLLHSGSGDIVLLGSTNHLETLLSGSGRIQGFSLIAATAKTVLAGSGYQQVWVTESLDVSITGSGNVFYRGRPNLISSYLSGTGKLKDDN
ncbi:MAG: head GIN domain-containing protein [Rufibacter sp.]